jgi:plasmid stabilization system protein ParE
MTFAVRELPKAKHDKRSIFAWLNERSPSGAVAWLDAYDALLERLAQDAASFGEATESHEFDLPIRQAFFKTRRGRVYRVVYFIERSDVFVLRVRGPGQAPISPQDIGG